jgi:hypothetical protein
MSVTIYLKVLQIDCLNTNRCLPILSGIWIPRRISYQTSSDWPTKDKCPTFSSPAAIYRFSLKRLGHAPQLGQIEYFMRERDVGAGIVTYRTGANLRLNPSLGP